MGISGRTCATAPLLGVALAWGSVALAIEPSADPATLPASPPASVAADTPCATCVTIPALTPVRVEILAPLGSKISKTGDMFPLRLAAPIALDGHVLVPGGTTGMGEVIHAKKGGGSGSAGELVLAVRYLDVGGRRLRLRSLHLASEGRSNIGTVNAINVGSAASPLPIGLIGFFITGGQATIAQGTIADARTAEPFAVEQPPPITPKPAEVEAATPQ